jgi:hypothetical protein
MTSGEAVSRAACAQQFGFGGAFAIPCRFLIPRFRYLGTQSQPSLSDYLPSDVHIQHHIALAKKPLSRLREADMASSSKPLQSSLLDTKAASPVYRDSPKPEFWRIRNIRSDERTVAREWLQAQVEELGIQEGQGFSLAADGERTLCATLTSRERPTPSYQGYHSWCVDKDFTGFIPLSDPEDANVDVVSITGLGGHALGSFRSADGASVWLRDFAPQDIPRARFITYGYNTPVVGSDNKQGVNELAHTLLDGLAIFRQGTRTQQRPLLFVCHSLGGVVLKEALVIGSKANEPKHRRLREVTTMTYGLVFMGVPNLGLKHNQLETIVKGRANERFIKDLVVTSDGEASPFLSYLTREFSDLDRQRRLPFEIVSYYETVSSPTVLVGVPLCALIQLRCDFTDYHTLGLG